MRNQSTLPDHLEENTIAGMDLGDTGYTVPWAMFAGPDRRLWIDGNFTIDSEPFGTAHMLIKRMSDGIDVQESTIGDHKFQANGEGRNGIVAPPAQFYARISSKEGHTEKKQAVEFSGRRRKLTPPPPHGRGPTAAPPDTEDRMRYTNNLDGQLIFEKDDTDEKIGRWAGWQHKRLVTIHDPSIHDAVIAALDAIPPPASTPAPEAGADEDLAPYGAHADLWQQVFDLRAALDAEREAHAATKDEASLVVSAAIKSLATEREHADGLRDSFEVSAETNHASSHEGDYANCGSCLFERIRIAAHDARRESEGEKGADGE